jgi:hypothetical protein
MLAFEDFSRSILPRPLSLGSFIRLPRLVQLVSLLIPRPAGAISMLQTHTSFSPGPERTHLPAALQSACLQQCQLAVALRPRRRWNPAAVEGACQGVLPPSTLSRPPWPRHRLYATRAAATTCRDNRPHRRQHMPWPPRPCAFGDALLDMPPPRQRRLGWSAVAS